MTVSRALSVYFITLNEEVRLAEALAQAVRVADELIVVDSGSTDRTVEIAQSYGARVVTESWTGFAHQKAFAARQCAHDWVLDLDADEVLSDALVDELLAWKSAPVPDRVAGYRMRWVYVPPYPGHPMRYAPDQWIPRLYHRGRAAIDDQPFSNNDRPQLQTGQWSQLKYPVWHKSVMTLSQLERKYCQLSSEQAADYVRTGRSIPSWRLALEFPIKFFKYFVLQQQFRNGWYGLSVSIISAYRNFMRFAKAKESSLKSD